MKHILSFIIWLFAISLSAQNLDLFEERVFEDKDGNTLPYRILYPKDYSKAKKYPFLLFLHGAGERGNDNAKQLTHIAPLLLDEREKAESEAIVILPQCPEGTWWVADSLLLALRDRRGLYVEHYQPMAVSMQLVDKLLDQMLALPQVDKERVAIMGLSMGAYGTYDLLSRRPTIFAKAVPICGGGNFESAKRFAPFTALKLFHGANDDVVNPDLSRAMYDRLKAIGADVTYKEYPNVKHDSWHNAFSEKGLMKWLTTAADTKYSLLENISYKSHASDAYINERCKLDFYYPTNRKGFSTVVWFHGGGLEVGEKFIPKELEDEGIAVVAVNYRLSPQANAPAYIEDAASAIAWAFDNIEKYGGSVKDIYVSGHSAGGYLSLISVMDKSYLEKHKIDADSIKGLIPISGQTITHNAIRKEKNLNDEIPLVERYAPLNQIRRNIPPTLLITGDRRRELISRFEENSYLESVMRAEDNDVTLYELQGFDHGTVLSPACKLLIDWIKSKKE